MRGEIHSYDHASGLGIINGDDNKKYTFERADLQQLRRYPKGTKVDFRADADRAREIFIIEQPERFGRDPQQTASQDGLSLFAYFKRCVTTDYANFSGRARRKEIWGFLLFGYVSIIGLSVLAVWLHTVAGRSGGDGYLYPIMLGSAAALLWLALLVPSVAVMVRRQHDIGISGWFFLLFLIPYFGSLILLVFALIPSQKQHNKWGAVPAGIAKPQE